MPRDKVVSFSSLTRKSPLYQRKRRGKTQHTRRIDTSALSTDLPKTSENSTPHTPHPHSVEKPVNTYWRVSMGETSHTPAHPMPMIETYIKYLVRVCITCLCVAACVGFVECLKSCCQVLEEYEFAQLQEYERQNAFRWEMFYACKRDCLIQRAKERAKTRRLRTTKSRKGGGTASGTRRKTGR